MNPLQDHSIGVPINSATYQVEKLTENVQDKSFRDVHCEDHDPANGSPRFSQNKVDSVVEWLNRCSKRADSFAHGVREHVLQGPKIYETVMGRLRFLQGGGAQSFFKQNFNFSEEEKVLKTCSCYLFTTAGPIAGFLFISTERLGFCSHRSLTFTCSNGESGKTLYKVSIPLRRVSNCLPSESMNKPSEKYLQIITVDNYEFWFKGFVNYHKVLKNLQRAMSF